VTYHVLLVPLSIFLLTQPLNSNFLPISLTITLLSFYLSRSATLLILHTLTPSPPLYYPSHRGHGVRVWLRLASTALVIAGLSMMDVGEVMGDESGVEGDVVSVSLLFCVVMVEGFVMGVQGTVCVCLLCCFRWSELSVLAPYVGVRGEVEVEVKEVRGESVSLEMIRRIPPLVYRSEMEWSEVCAICMVEVEVGERVRQFTCGHGYHVDCIDAWLVRKRVCPLCVAVVKLPAVATAEVNVIGS
jgi:hypothetical protein